MAHRHGSIGWKALLFLLVALALLVASCAPAAPAPTPTAPPAATSKPAATAPTATPVPPSPTPKKVVKLVSGESSPGFNEVFHGMGLEKGFYKEEGLDVEVLGLGSSENLKAMVAGREDTVHMNPFTAMPAIAQGADMVLVASSQAIRDILIVKEGINSVKDLEGRSFGTEAVGSQPYVIAQRLFTKNGLDPKKVTMVSIGNDSARAAAIFAGRVDATTVGLENLPMVEKTPGVKVLLAVREALPELSLASGIFAQGKLMREQPDVVKSYLKARMRGVRYALDHKDEAVALAMKILKSEDKAGLSRTYDDYMKAKVFDANFVFTPEQLDAVQEALITLGTIKQKVPFDKMANVKFAKELV
ncbi:MAG: ABC transporter substrate-binding protein, partial [Dehalococcoidia bacterium]|nr:ABC transporter substrate-binding protein [Dehalococcoidia bacterium]